MKKKRRGRCEKKEKNGFQTIRRWSGQANYKLVHGARNKKM
jgi:hypothetical protein